ncbi:methyl-accepting chemotaxis sensory transducer with TarH sensor [Enterobacter sp. BIGb0383]|uniref:methyl-accepting chemotaxis protein n=1 Tax=unclassified Enterobacter TaxID=2608935 RepID=UPI000F45F15E|nr:MULTISPECIES: methyl-accepting chemotaxis protein [unclassified Enterobacter]ROP58309.1 methyl-accepting chemotaxis sensory transducer with TarH sensor [Enterobacter sp. BIGb0383]ROS06803.1 methyl-accepting chemotaxis sensory transducer with TarH sensor [Enterobacter sp. BIGb0359]
MLKNLNISTGLNALMIVFVLFLATVSALNFNNVHNFSGQINEAVSVASANNTLQDAVSDLNNSVGLVVLESYQRSGIANYSPAKETFNNINMLIGRSAASYKNFVDQPDISEAEHAELVRVYKAFDDLMAFTLRQKEALIDPTKTLPSLTELGVQVNTLRSALKAETDSYNRVLSTTLAQRMQDTEQQNTRMLTVAGMILLLSIIIVYLTRMWLKSALFRRLDQTKENFTIIASGDLSRPIETGAHNEIGEMLVELEKMRQSLTATVSDIRLGTTSIYGSAQEIANSNSDLSSRTEQQASALQETAASMEELKITVRQNADNAHSAKQLVEGASNSARKGGDVMVNLDGIMREITENSRQIADINGVIDSIANQTNILALNAAVEAARAGEQGRGFAVVAGEVRSLAKRSADAAKEIRQLINVCVANMNTGSQEVELAGTAMKEVVKSVTQVTDIMAEITSASEEQSTGINQIAQAVNEMDLVTQQNASMVEQAASIARSVEENAHDLERTVSRFSLEKSARGSEVRAQKTAGQAVMKKPTAHRDPAFIKSKAEEDWISF